MPLLLGVETSCDETSAAVVRDGEEILSNVVLSQDVHAVYGGVVPELASREHIRTITPVVRRAVEDAGVGLADLDGVAATVGPGLLGSVVVGMSTARSLAWALGIPFVGVHHLEGHLFSLKLAHPGRRFEFIGLIVSGGHTELVEVSGEGKYRLLGETRDDAAGEAFDKVAKMTSLPYPGGPHVERMAKGGDPARFPFREAKLKGNQLDFSFSGIKTAVRYKIRDLPELLEEDQLPHLLAGFQSSVVSTLAGHAREAILVTGAGAIALCGGVAANGALRAAVAEVAAEVGVELLVPPIVLCTDNAAMIAAAGDFRFRQGLFAPPDLGASSDIPLPYSHTG